MTDEQTRALAAIHQRLAVCTQAGDARRADAYAESFTRDGVLELLHETIAGREAIRAWMKAPSVIPAPAGGAPSFISHHLTTCHVDLNIDPNGTYDAVARTYWMVTSAAGLDHNGFYVDKLTREDDGEWRIAHRRPRTLWISPQSVLHGQG